MYHNSRRSNTVARSILFILSITFLLAQNTLAKHFDVETACMNAVPADLNTTHRGYDLDAGNTHLVQLDVPSAGILALDLSAYDRDAVEPRIGFFRDWCGKAMMGGDSAVTIERSAAHLVLAVRAAGTYTFRLGAQDPRRALGEYKLTSRFVAATVTEDELYLGTVAQSGAGILASRRHFFASEPTIKSDEDQPNPDPGYKSGEDQPNPDPGYQSGEDQPNPDPGYQAPSDYLLTLVTLKDADLHKSGEDQPNPDPGYRSGEDQPNPDPGFQSGEDQPNPDPGYTSTSDDLLTFVTQRYADLHKNGEDQPNPDPGYKSDEDQPNPDPGYQSGEDQPNPDPGFHAHPAGVKPWVLLYGNQDIALAALAGSEERPRLEQLCRRGELDDVDDGFTCATPIASGDSVRGEIRNDWGDDTDVFELTLDDLRTVTLAVTGDVATYLELYDRNGQRLETLLASGEGAQMVKTLTPGHYFLRVSGVRPA